MNATVTTIRRRPSAGVSHGLSDSLHPVLREIFAARGVTGQQELDYTLANLPPASDLLGVDSAVSLLEQVLEKGQHVLIVADFDADGATSCAVALRALRSMGAADVTYLVPDRFRFGYGLSPEIVEVAAQRKPNLIITVDNGISSLEGVAAAKAQGIPVLITDHHLPGEQLPDAAAIVNPSQPSCAFPAKNLAGVGVIFYLMLALRSRRRETGWFDQHGLTEPNLADLLDLVALGTVADVVPLDRYNRILVEQGLRRIRAGKGCLGINALIAAAGRNPQRLVAADLGYAVGPRLNAAGRLTEMTTGINCLLCDEPEQAREMAAELDQLNHQRRAIEQQMRQQAWRILDGLDLRDGPEQPFGLCLYDASWHQGVVGILASRVKERLHRPVIAFAKGEDGRLKGSARSVKGVHIRDVLHAVTTRESGLVDKFGGHAMAAGLTLAPEKLEPFQILFDDEVRNHLNADDLRGALLSDGELPTDDYSLVFAQALRDAGPWGQEFPEPLFDDVFEVINQRVVGGRHLKLVLRNAQAEQLLDAIQFNADEENRPQPGEFVRVAFRLDINEYRQQHHLQLIIEYFERA